jgi:hypothetical protein
LKYITRRLYVLEEENVALKDENAHLNKRLSSLEDDNHELMKNVKLIKELSNTLKEKTKTVVPVNKGLKSGFLSEKGAQRRADLYILSRYLYKSELLLLMTNIIYKIITQ